MATDTPLTHKLKFAPEYGWADKPNDRENDHEKYDVRFLHRQEGTPVPVEKCNCYRCLQHRFGKKKFVMKDQLQRDLTQEEETDLWRQICVAT